MPTGICRICGRDGELSFEHVPPQAAFNNRKVFTLHGQDALRWTPESGRELWQIDQRGAGDHTLCPPCNNNTGSWYGPAFVEWAYQGMRILLLSNGRPTLDMAFHIFPLRVIKQVACMFFSANGDSFRLQHPDLVHFVLDKERRYLDPRVRIFAYFNPSFRARQTGIAVRGDINTGKVWILSEIAFHPIGYVMTIDSPSPDDRLVEISFFAKYAYNKWSHIWLRLPALPIHSPLPSDYRRPEEIGPGPIAKPRPPLGTR